MKIGKVLAHSITTRRPQMLKWVSWARYACTIYKMYKSWIILMSLSLLFNDVNDRILHMSNCWYYSETVLSIYLSFLVFFLLHNIIRSVQNFSRLCLFLVFFSACFMQFFCPSMSIKVCVNHSEIPPSIIVWH